MRPHRQLLILLLMFAGGQSEPGRITMDAFVRMYALKAVLVLDVRGIDAYRAGHIAGAVHVPLDQIAERAEEIRSLIKPPDSVVTYCSCLDEHASLAAVRVLADHGIPHASALIGGYPEWVERGGKIEKAKSQKQKPKTKA